jgi:hypothetical protein
VKLISVTMTGSGRAAVIGNAIRSVVDRVDAVHVMDTGADLETIEAAREAAGGKLVLHHWTWQRDFGAARNAALDVANQAHARGEADWCLIVDTDETINFPEGFDLRRCMEGLEAESLVRVALIEHDSRSFRQYRLFKLPAKLAWRGRVHEAYNVERADVGQLRGVCFRSQDRPDEDLTLKFTVYRELLDLEIRDNPRDQRWHYYMGDTCAVLGDHDAALRAWSTGADLSGTPQSLPDQGAWCCYRAGHLLRDINRPADSMRAVLRGVRIQPAMAELHWLGSVVALESGDAETAVAMALEAERHGSYKAALEGNVVPRRIGFSFPPAQWELPFQVLFAAYKELGAGTLSAEAGDHYILAQRARHAPG